MKRLIYGSLIVLCVLVGFLVLLLYYTQDFSEELKFVNSLNLSKDFVSDSTIESINWIETKLGTLDLENNGYFSQSYDLPIIVGCLNLVSGSEIILPQENFRVSIGGIESWERNIEVPVGTKVSYDLIAHYSPSYASVSFNSLRENVESVSLYSFNQKEKNPFGTLYYESVDSLSCADLAREKTPVKIIVLLN